MESSTVSATPLILSTKSSNDNDNKSSDGNELKFYDPDAVLTVSREVAWGYLILLTGGNFEYEAPTLTEKQLADQEQQHDNNNNRETTSPILGEETSQLAYAAIVDGNVLHAVFGLKATANGKANNIINEKPKSSIFCCLSSSTLDALEFILSHSAKNKVKMQQLIEALQEVRDLYFESLEVPEDTSANFTLHVDIIKAYVNCFNAITRYHDQISLLEKLNGKESMFESVVLFNSKKKKQRDKTLEDLRAATLNEIEHGFNGLREEIWEKLEQTTGATAAISEVTTSG